ncbi:MAG: ferredoxin [Chloroflexi bacterium]|nr:ferredoxin [Chloroflexota bacterium]
MKLRITVDRDLCIGVANCVAIAPQVFALDDENRATVVHPQGADEGTIINAAESCPTLAIILEDEETGRKVYP